MSFDAISLIRQFVTPELIAKIAAALGLERNQAQSAVGALIPAILSGLLGAGQRPGGARSLAEAAGAQDQSILGNLTNIIGGGGQKSLVDSGTTILGSLLGGGTAGALASAVGRFSGVGESGAKGLMGLLGPIVLGALGQQQRSSGLDANGLVNLLAGQKDKIARALPAGFAKELKGTGLLDSVAAQLPRGVSEADQSVESTAPSLPSFLPWLAGLAALAFVLWFLTGRPHDPVPSGPPVDISTAAGATQRLNALGDRLRMVLGSVNDEASAKAALPRLTDMAAELEQLQGAAAKLPAADRTSLSSIISALLAVLAPKIEDVLKIPGVGPILKPVIDSLQARLSKIGSA